MERKELEMLLLDYEYYSTRYASAIDDPDYRHYRKQAAEHKAKLLAEFDRMAAEIEGWKESWEQAHPRELPL